MANKKTRETQKSNKPTGLTISRNGRSFTLSWKSSSTNEKQVVTHGINNEPFPIVHNVDPSESSKAITISDEEMNYYYPNTNSYIKKIRMRVCRKAATRETEKKIITYTTSDYEYKDFELYSLSQNGAPKPTAVASKVNDLEAMYEFSVSPKDNSHYWVLGIETQTCWTKCEDITDPASIKEFDNNIIRPFDAEKDHNKWHDPVRYPGTSFSINKKENFIDTGKTNVYYTRWYRFRTYGPGGVGKWYYVWFTFGTPYRPVINSTSIERVESSQTYILHAKWKVPSNRYTRPVDKVDVQYCVGKPSTELHHHIDPDQLFEYKLSKQMYRLLRNSQYKYRKVRNPVDENLYKYYEKSGSGYKKTTDTTVRSGKVYYTRKLIKYIRAKLEDLREAIDDMYILDDVLPENPTWNNLVEDFPDTKGLDGVYKQFEMTLGDDECVWVRILADHAGWKRFSAIKLLKPKDFTYKLADPDKLSAEIGDNNNLVEISVPVKTQVEKADIVVVCKEKGEKNAKPIPIGVLEYDDYNPAILSYPSSLENKVHFGAYSAILDDVEEEEQLNDNGEYDHSIYTFEVANDLQSDIQWDGGLIPARPKITLLEYVYDEDGPSIHVKWVPPRGVREVEISWSDKKHGWYSDSDPSTKVIKSIDRNEIYILSVERGGTYYVRARSIRYDSDTPTYSGYTKRTKIVLADTPETPELFLSKDAVTVDGSFTASWNYVSEDGTTQKSAIIVPANMEVDSNGNVTGTITSYGSSIAVVNNASKSVTFSAADLIKNFKWAIGSTHYISVMVTTTADKTSAYSKPVSITILSPLTCKISSSSLVYRGTTQSNDLLKMYRSDGSVSTISDNEANRAFVYLANGTAIDIGNRGFYTLNSLPLTVNISGAGFSNHVNVSIIRAVDYFLPRPNGDTAGGYEGDIVASIDRYGDGPVTFTLNDLNQDRYFDDGAAYLLKAVVTDNYGQSSDTNDNSDDERLFIVEWTNQALAIPDRNVSIAIDYTSYRIPIAKIRVTPPIGVRNTDRFDIYRLSSDKPELIFKGAEFNTDYVDPYPTIGTKGGYRIVFMTANGDFITSENKLAWVNADISFAELYGLENDIFFKTINNIIDFGGSTVNIPYNIDLSTTWKKDFKETKYLGGHVIGDWNEGVSRTGSINTEVATDNAETLAKLRQLAVYSGVCHVRTIDGSNYKADVQISENHSYRSYVITSYSLNITRVDSYSLDGMTLSDWETYYA